MGNKQPLDRDITFTTPDEGTAKTTPRLEGLREDKNSGGNKPPADMELQNPTYVDLLGSGAKEPDTQPMLLTYADSRAILLFEDKAQENQTDQLVEDYMSSLEKISSTINDLYKGLEVITPLLKDITNSIKDDPVTKKKIEESSKTLAKISTETTEIFSLVRIFDFSTL
nr:hypothetical protein [Tanacetum cinerariifolium]